ncbi:MAG: Crp/Fnr family transcriptional regulator [Thermoanaerobaculaceae bacterium]|nr:Crp/Fnr family transcriptional regulator [Thermoanaerobaculaceae bacterium]
MDTTALTRALRRTPLFETLQDAALSEIVGLTSVHRLERGEVLFWEGDPATFLPVVLSGRVKLFRSDSEGREQVLHVMRAPASFAEAAVFGPGIFPATAQALEPGTVARVASGELVALLRRRPEVALAILTSFSLWMRRLVDLIDGLALRSVEERVAAYLWSAFVRSGLTTLQGATLRLEEPKHVVASLCGTAPEVLSRTFRRLERSGVVRVEGPQVVLLDPEALATLAGA